MRWPPLTCADGSAPLLPPLPFTTCAVELTVALIWFAAFCATASEPCAIALPPFGRFHCDSRFSTKPEIICPFANLPVWPASTSSLTGCHRIVSMPPSCADKNAGIGTAPPVSAAYAGPATPSATVAIVANSARFVGESSRFMMDSEELGPCQAVFDKRRRGAAGRERTRAQLQRQLLVVLQQRRILPEWFADHGEHEPVPRLREILFEEDPVAERRVRDKNAAVLRMFDDHEMLISVDVHQHHHGDLQVIQRVRIDPETSAAQPDRLDELLHVEHRKTVFDHDVGR